VVLATEVRSAQAVERDVSVPSDDDRAGVTEAQRQVLLALGALERTAETAPTN
jgi:hypothetical protein